MNESIIALLLVTGLLLVVIMVIALISKPRLDKNYFAKHWVEIENEPSPMSALIKADTLVDEAMKRAHIKGATMGERLKKGGAHFKDINGLWSAHKLRNRLVHEPGAEVSQADLQKALQQLKKSLKDLGAL
jgi:hypothetical protein